MKYTSPAEFMLSCPCAFNERVWESEDRAAFILNPGMRQAVVGYDPTTSPLAHTEYEAGWWPELDISCPSLESKPVLSSNIFYSYLTNTTPYMSEHLWCCVSQITTEDVNTIHKTG